MPCNDKDIKELLPLFLTGELPDEERERVVRHLAVCGDCRSERDLLRSLAGEAVPDPGEAFWASFPDRVYREVRRHEVQKERSGLSALLDRFRVPRWAWAAASLLLVAAITWYALLPAPARTAKKHLPAGNGSYEDVLSHDQLALAELNTLELESLDAWATTELAPYDNAIADLFLNGPEGSIEERLADMNAQELEQLSSMLDTANQEG